MSMVSGRLVSVDAFADDRPASHLPRGWKLLLMRFRQIRTN